jgi:hypothetical protein
MKIDEPGSVRLHVDARDEVVEPGKAEWREHLDALSVRASVYPPEPRPA